MELDRGDVNKIQTYSHNKYDKIVYKQQIV